MYLTNDWFTESPLSLSLLGENDTTILSDLPGLVPNEYLH